MSEYDTVNYVNNIKGLFRIYIMSKVDEAFRSDISIFMNYYFFVVLYFKR